MNEMLLIGGAKKKNKTLLLMHMDKVNTRNYTDERGTPVTVAANAGLMRAAGKINAGGYFCVLNNESGLVTPEFNWTPGSSNWTMEFWCNRFSAANFMRAKAASPNAAHISFDASGNANFYINNVLIYSIGAHVIGLNVAWGHVAFVRSGDSFSLYVGGVLRVTLSGATYPALRNAVFRPFNLTDLSGFSTHNYAQYSDELRISNVARYTSEFTPQLTNFELD